MQKSVLRKKVLWKNTATFLVEVKETKVEVKNLTNVYAPTYSGTRKLLVL